MATSSSVHDSCLSSLRQEEAVLSFAELISFPAQPPLAGECFLPVPDPIPINVALVNFAYMGNPLTDMGWDDSFG